VRCKKVLRAASRSFERLGTLVGCDQAGPPGKLDSSPAYVVVEGFVLFAEPPLVDLLDHLVWLKCSAVTASQRRCLREHSGPMGADLYMHHVAVAHEQYQGLLRRNVEHRTVIEVDAEQAEEAMTATVLQQLCLPARASSSTSK
jgi:hypothetical protein